MAKINWHAPIVDYTGPFISAEELKQQSHVFRMLSGAEKFPDELGGDGGDGDSTVPSAARAIPAYDAEIAAIAQQWAVTQSERQNNLDHIKDLTEKVTNSMARRQWVAFIKPPRMLPRFSSFSREDQRFVVDMLARYWATGVPSNPPLAEERDVHRLMRLLSEIRKEQEEYIQFAKEVNATQLDRYNFLRNDIKRYTQQWMQAKFRHAARTYPSSYEPVTMLALAPPAGAPPLLTPISEPLELGTVPVCVMPSLRSYTDVNRQTSFLEMLFPTGDLYPRERETGYAARDGTYLYKTPVSADPNVPLLSAQQEFDLVTSPSALKALLDNSAPAWERAWELPVTVRLVPGTQPGTHRKAVFLDKPLPPRSMNSMERNARAHKRTVRILMCKRATGTEPADYSIWEEQRARAREQQRKEIIANKVRKRKLKTAKKKEQAEARKLKKAQQGEHSGLSEKRPRLDSSPVPCEDQATAPDADGGETSEAEDSDDDGLQIDCPVSEEEAEGGRPAEDAACEEDAGGQAAGEGGGPAAAGGVGAGSDSSAAEPRGDAGGPDRAPACDGGTSGGHSGGETPRAADQPTAPSSEPEPEPRPGGTAAPESAAPREKREGPYLCPPPGLNVHYQVWQLGSLRLLVRASTHSMRENPNAGLVRYSVHPKVAYQAAYGIEVMTRSELISQWLDCLLRPNSRVARVHLEHTNQLVMAVEERSLSQLTEEFVKYDTGFRPPYALQALESVLRELTSQPPGQYLLSHDSRAGAFVRLSRASASGGGSVQLSLPLEPRWVALESPRSLAIDPSILIPFNTRNGRVPATFRYKKAPDVGWKEHWTKMKEQGITRTNKKKNKKKKNVNRHKNKGNTGATDEPSAPS